MATRTIKKYKATTNSEHDLPVQEIVLNQEFTVSKPNEEWVTGITYIPTMEGWLYLSSVMDLYSRKIIRHLERKSEKRTAFMSFFFH